MFFYSFPVIKMSFFLSYNLISFMPFPCYKKAVPFPDYFLNRIFYSTEGIIRYLGRYRARSPVAEYKITEIDDGKVTFFFNDLSNNKKKTYITIFRNITTKIVTNIEIRCLILLFIYQPPVLFLIIIPRKIPLIKFNFHFLNSIKFPIKNPAKISS